MFHIEENEIGAGDFDDLRQSGREELEDHRAKHALAGREPLLYRIGLHRALRCSRSDEAFSAWVRPDSRDNDKVHTFMPSTGLRHLQHIGHDGVGTILLCWEDLSRVEYIRGKDAATPSDAAFNDARDGA